MPITELKYHIVWCTKYRRKVLTPYIQDTLKELINGVATKNKYKIEALEVMEDHIHVFLSASGKDSIHRIVSQLKGSTSYCLRDIYPELKSKLPCMWTRSYYAGTVGYVLEETVKKYIENQKSK
jgi:putative transposase